MSKTLVAYFSAETGKTAKVAKAFAESAEAEIFEIIPEKPYTAVLSFKRIHL